MKKNITYILFSLIFGNFYAQNCQSSFDFTNSSNSDRSIYINTITPHDLYSPADGFTWECWFNLGSYNSNTLTSPAYLISAVDKSLYNDIALGFNWPVNPTTPGLIFMLSDNTNGGRAIIKSTKFVKENAWHHAAAVCDYNGNKIYLYLNDTLVDSTTIVIPLAKRLTNVAVTIGNDDRTVNAYLSSSASFVGAIDEVRFWKGVRTQSQIISNKNICLPATTPNLIAYYKADENSSINSANFMSSSYPAILKNNAGWGIQKGGLSCCAAAHISDNTQMPSGLDVHVHPDNEKLVIEADNYHREKALLTLYDLNGQNVLSTDINLNEQNNIDITLLYRGLYIVSIQSATISVIKKIIK